MKKSIIVLSILAALALQAHATIIWQATSATSTNGWTAFNEENGAYIENHAQYYRCHVFFVTNSSTLFHCEPHLSNVAQEGDDLYFGQQFRLPSAYWNDSGKNHVIQQIASDDGAWQGWGLNGQELYGITMTMDVWHQLTAHYQFTTSGARQVWVDGQIIVNDAADNNWPFGTNVFPRWSVGLYEPNWHNAAAPTGGLTHRALDHAQVRLATSYAEAQPFGGNFEIVSANSGLVANVSGASLTNGAPVIQWSFKGTSPYNDEWQMVNLTNGYYEIENRNSSQAMNVSGASLTNGAPIIQWPFGTKQNDQWQLVDLDNGYFEVINRHSGLALDVPGKSTAKGTQFDQWPVNGQANQQWQFINVP
jgi:hypothetical protein